MSVPVPAAPAAPSERDTLLCVDPLKINLVYRGDDVREIARCASEVRDGDWDRPARRTFAEEPVFRALVEVLVLGRAWEDTKFFARVRSEIEAGRTKFGCSTVDELRAREAHIRRLYHDIREHGYRSQAELGSRRAHDEVRVAIGRDGRFLFVDGRHRLAIARLLGVRRIPVRVTLRHPGWEAVREQVRAYAAQRDGRVYQVIDHPDLAWFPAHHDAERVALVQGALADQPAAGRRLLDIGTHWGYMARRLEPLGFECTGVELNKRNARMAQALSVATESSLRVWQGDVFAFPELEEQHVVLALNVFHHLIKTQERHDGLAAMLGRLRRAEVIVFEAHKSRDAQLRDAYRNYPGDEFAAFVAHHAGMSTVTPIGHAADGRPLYRMSTTTPLRPTRRHVVVTGCAGFIGSHVVESLLAAGAQVTGIDHFTDAYPRAAKLANLDPARPHPAFRLLDLDLASAPLHDVVNHADAVVHLAAEPGVRSSWGERFAVYVRNNLVATQRLLDAACGWGSPRFVYASSSSVYGQAERLPTAEDVVPEPVSPYGVTKLGGEHLCAAYRAGHGLPTVTLRLFSVFGPRQRPDMAFARFCAAALEGERVVVYGDGRQTRDFTYVGDVVRAIHAALDAPDAVGGTYNIGGGTRSSLADAIAEIGAITGAPLGVCHEAAAAGDVRDTAADTRRAACDLHFTAATSLADGLAAQVAWTADQAGAERAA